MLYVNIIIGKSKKIRKNYPCILMLNIKQYKFYGSSYSPNMNLFDSKNKFHVYNVPRKWFKNQSTFYNFIFLHSYFSIRVTYDTEAIFTISQTNTIVDQHCLSINISKLFSQYRQLRYRYQILETSLVVFYRICIFGIDI